MISIGVFLFPHHVSGFKSILVILKVLGEFWRFWEGKQIILENLEEFCHFGDFKGIFWSFKGYRGILTILKIKRVFGDFENFRQLSKVHK